MSEAAAVSGPLLMGRRRVVVLVVVGAIYFVIGMGLDMLLALLPAVATAFVVSSASVVWVSTGRSSTRFLSPLIGRLTDGLGRKAIVVPGLFIFGLGNLLSSGMPHFGWFILTQAVVGLGLTAMQVSLPAYLGDLFPYQVRGRAFGAATICSAAGTMLGVPAGAFLADAFGVRTAFLALGLLAVALAPLALWLLVTPPAAAEAQTDEPAKPRAAWFAPLRLPVVRAAMAITMCWLMVSAGMYSFIGAWLSGTFSFTTSQIGLTFSLMGGASVLSNVLVASFSDRVGKRRAAMLGLLLGTACLVPMALAQHPAIALTAIALQIITNEFGFGAYLALLTELIPAQRGMVMSLNMTAWGVGVTIAPLLGSLIWASGGFSAVVLSVTVVGLVAFVLAYFFLSPPVREGALLPAQP